MDLRTYSNLCSISLPGHLFWFLCWYPDAQSEICPNVAAFLKWFTRWHYYEAAIKLSNLKFLLCFITLGHFLLLSSSRAAEDSGICEYHLTSPVFPGSGNYCNFQVALYESGPAVGNLTLLIKPVLSGSAVRSVVLKHRSRDDRRLANTLRTGSPCHCDAVCVEQLFILLVRHLCSTTRQLN